MEHSKKIAGLVGPILLAITLPEALHIHTFDTQIAPVVYLNGALLFAGGFSLVRAHNYWGFEWPMVLTLVGWFGILVGLFRLFFTELALAETQMTPVAVAASFSVAFVGLFLTYKAHR